MRPVRWLYPGAVWLGVDPILIRAVETGNQQAHT